MRYTHLNTLYDIIFPRLAVSHMQTDGGSKTEAPQGDSGQGNEAQGGNIVSENGNRKGGGMVSLFP